MPHIIIEYPAQRVNYSKVDAILKTIHNTIAESGLFKTDQIRTRAYAFKNFTNAGGSEPFIHIQARIKSGRDVANKKQLSNVILNGFSALNIPVSVITVEIIDMERESYGKI